MLDPIALAIFQSATHSIAEEMGSTLRRTAVSPNMKERRDYSCAVFDSQRHVIAMGDHMPVHLGSMPMSVQAAAERIAMRRGDVVMLNDPYAGGTHLPDITMVAPVFLHAAEQPTFYVAARAHHSDVGGMFAGSMGSAREIFQEGIRIPPIRLVRGGEVDEELMELLLHNVRTPLERAGDFAAQIGACRVGEERLLDLAARHGEADLEHLIHELLAYSERLIRAELRKLPEGEFVAEDYLDDDGVSSEPIRIAVAVRTRPAEGAITFDFTGSSPQVAGSVNAVYAITASACFYVLRCLLTEDAPATAGILRAMELIAPEGSVVHAQPPAAVAAGNVETSQRIVDVVLRALAQAMPERIPAASSGTMNNLTVGGIDPRNGAHYTYYETTAGGMGARPAADGLSGVHTHMTNSLNTPVEALEYAYPFRVHRYGYRPGSGGRGRFRGGDGIVREIELLAPAQVTLLCERRRFAPYGLAGGEDGATGRTVLITPDGERELPAKGTLELKAGDRIRMETPGGGGWGAPNPASLNRK